MADDFGCTEGYTVYDRRNFSVELLTTHLLSSHSEAMLTYTLFAVIVVVGLVANFLFLVVVYKDKKLHTVMNAYLVNLAVADMIILFYGYIDRVYFYAYTPVIVHVNHLGPISCVANHLFEFTYYASLLIVTLFSMERYVAICYPMRHIQINSAKRTTIILVGVWFFSFILAALQIPAKGKRDSLCIIFPEELSHLTGDYHRCLSFLDGPYTTYITIILQRIPFYAAMIGSGFFYTMIILKLRRRQPAVGGDGDDLAAAAVTRARNAATRMIIINGCAFFLCNAPLQIYATITWIFGLVGRPTSPFNGLSLILTLLLYLNSTINPFIYGATNRQYRRAFLSLLPKSRQDNLRRDVTDKTVSTNM